MIKCAKPIKVNKNSYIKPGSHIAKTGEEDPLFDNMFEIILNEEYEEVYKAPPSTASTILTIGLLSLGPLQKPHFMDF